jgi:hypothetical protein
LQFHFRDSRESQMVIPPAHRRATMRPKKQKTTGEGDLFRARLDQIINMKHELVQLAGKIDWDWIDREIAPLYSKNGRPGIATRFVIGRRAARLRMLSIAMPALAALRDAISGLVWTKCSMTPEGANSMWLSRSLICIS